MNLLITALTPVIWATTYYVTTEFLPPGRPILAGVLRALPAGLIILAWFRVLPRGQWWWKATVLGVVNIGAFFGFLFWTAYLLPGGVAAVVTNTAPLWVIGLAPLILGTRLKGMQVIAGAVAIIGVAALVLGPGVQLNTLGVLTGLGGSLCMAFGIILAKKLGTPEGVPGLAVTGWQLTIGGLFLVPFLLIEGLPDHLTATNIGGYAYLGLIGGAFAYGIWFRGIALLDPVQVAMLGILSPLTATLIGVVFNDERLSPVQWAGGVAVVVALLLANLASVPGRGGRGRRQPGVDKLIPELTPGAEAPPRRSDR